MRICSEPGCLVPCLDTVRYCDEHAKEHAQDIRTAYQRDNAELQKEYVGSRWKALRIRVLQRFPFCTACNQQPSRVVDHIVPVIAIIAACRVRGLFAGQRHPGFYLMHNLTGLCHHCHNSKTKVEDQRTYNDEIDALLAPFEQEAK